jgi:hypothetical protein
MSTDDTTPDATPEGIGSDPAGAAGAEGRQPSEAELMAAYEEQMKSIRVEEVVVQSLASLIEIGGRRAGLVPGAQDEADPTQLQVAIEAIKALQPVAAPLIGPNKSQIEQALSQLQLAFARMTGQSGAPGAAGGGASGDKPSDPGPSRLWVPGQ